MASLRHTMLSNKSEFKVILESTFMKEVQSCERKKVVCCIIDPQDGRVYSAFVNRSLGVECSGQKGRCGCIHAEPQAVIWAMLHSNSKQGFILGSTYAPCSNCANLIVMSAKFAGVVFANYTDHDMGGLSILSNNDIAFVQINCNLPDVK